MESVGRALRETGERGDGGGTAPKKHSAVHAQRETLSHGDGGGPRPPQDRVTLSLHGTAMEMWKDLRRAHPDRSASEIFEDLARATSDPRTAMNRCYEDYLRAARSHVGTAELNLVAWLKPILTSLVPNLTPTNVRILHERFQEAAKPFLEGDDP